MILGRVAASAEKEAAPDPENAEPTPEVVELVVSRMKKGHSCAQARWRLWPMGSGTCDGISLPPWRGRGGSVSWRRTRGCSCHRVMWPRIWICQTAGRPLCSCSWRPATGQSTWSYRQPTNRDCGPSRCMTRSAARSSPAVTCGARLRDSRNHCRPACCSRGSWNWKGLLRIQVVIVSPQPRASLPLKDRNRKLQAISATVAESGQAWSSHESIKRAKSNY